MVITDLGNALINSNQNGETADAPTPCTSLVETCVLIFNLKLHFEEVEMSSSGARDDLFRLSKQVKPQLRPDLPRQQAEHQPPQLCARDSAAPQLRNVKLHTK
jgi:hypothetical protein